MKFQTQLYELSKGKMMNNIRGNPIFILYTVGRKTGKLRKTPLIYFEDNSKFIIIASNSGSDHNPSWYYNIKSSESAKINLKGNKINCSAQFATEEEKIRIWPMVDEKASFYADYRKKASRKIPIIILTPIA